MLNVQHDCYGRRCGLEQQARQQEREKTELARDVIKHSDAIHYVLNTHSLHNYKAISDFTTLLSSPPPILAEGEATQFRLDAAAAAGDKRLAAKMAKESAKLEKVMGRATVGVLDDADNDDDAEVHANNDDDYDDPLYQDSSARTFGHFDVPIGTPCDSGGAPLASSTKRTQRQAKLPSRYAEGLDIAESESDFDEPPAKRRRVNGRGSTHGRGRARGGHR